MMQLVSAKSSFTNEFLKHNTPKVSRRPCLITSSAAACPDSTRRNVIVGTAAALVVSSFFKLEPAVARTSAKRDVKPEVREKLKEEIAEIKKNGKKVASLDTNAAAVSG